jgi:hypothetical protein
MLTSETDRHAFKTRDFRFADWEKIKAYLASTNFYQLFYSNLPAPAILDEFYKIINTCIELYVPEKINVSSKNCVLSNTRTALGVCFDRKPHVARISHF